MSCGELIAEVRWIIFGMNVSQAAYLFRNHTLSTVCRQAVRGRLDCSR